MQMYVNKWNPNKMFQFLGGKDWKGEEEWQVKNRLPAHKTAAFLLDQGRLVWTMSLHSLL